MQSPPGGWDVGGLQLFTGFILLNRHKSLRQWPPGVYCVGQSPGALFTARAPVQRSKGFLNLNLGWCLLRVFGVIGIRWGGERHIWICNPLDEWGYWAGLFLFSWIVWDNLVSFWVDGRKSTQWGGLNIDPKSALNVWIIILFSLYTIFIALSKDRETYA